MMLQQALSAGKARPTTFPACSTVWPPREHGAGLMMMSDCKYGYRGEGSSLGLTLLNSSTSPDPYPERGIHQFAIGLTACTDHPAMAENKATAFCRNIQYQSNGIHAGTLPTEKAAGQR